MSAVQRTDISLPDFWQGVRDGREIAVDMEHGQVVVNSGGAHQLVDRTRAAVLSFLGELVLRVVYPTPSVFGNRGSATEGIEFAG